MKSRDTRRSWHAIDSAVSKESDRKAIVAAQQDRQHLRESLLSGARSPLTSPADASYFDSLRQRVCKSP